MSLLRIRKAFNYWCCFIRVVRVIRGSRFLQVKNDSRSDTNKAKNLTGVGSSRYTQVIRLEFSSFTKGVSPK